jgi:hypothetical protein
MPGPVSRGKARLAGLTNRFDQGEHNEIHLAFATGSSARIQYHKRSFPVDRRMQGRAQFVVRSSVTSAYRHPPKQLLAVKNAVALPSCPRVKKQTCFTADCASVKLLPTY